MVKSKIPMKERVDAIRTVHKFAQNTLYAGALFGKEDLCGNAISKQFRKVREEAAKLSDLCENEAAKIMQTKAYEDYVRKQR